MTFKHKRFRRADCRLPAVPSLPDSDAVARSTAGVPRGGCCAGTTEELFGTAEVGLMVWACRLLVVTSGAVAAISRGGILGFFEHAFCTHYPEFAREQRWILFVVEQEGSFNSVLVLWRGEQLVTD